MPDSAPKVNYKLPGFISKFLELQQVMWTTNAGLTDRHMYDSRPDAWPRLRRGIVSDLLLIQSESMAYFGSLELLGKGQPPNLPLG